MLINVTLPVINEQTRLAVNFEKVEAFLRRQMGLAFDIVIVNNGSTDHTLVVAQQFARRFSGVRVLDVGQSGRGSALKRSWQSSSADVLTYMDIDLPTELEAFRTVVDAVRKDGFEVAVGSCHLPQSHVRRGWKREISSRCYNFLARALVRTRIAGLQCGFKAISRAAARELLPLVEDSRWFFATELLVIGERLGYRICEVPVRWVEDRDSRVKLCRTALADLRGLLRLRRRLLTLDCFASVRVPR